MNTYDIGDLVRLSATFAVGGVTTDPTTVTFKIKVPGGTITTYVYVTDAQLVKDSTGAYHVDWPVTADGTYWYRFAGAGIATDAEELSFEVRPSRAT